MRAIVCMHVPRGCWTFRQHTWELVTSSRQCTSHAEAFLRKNGSLNHWQPYTIPLYEVPAVCLGVSETRVWRTSGFLPILCTTGKVEHVFNFTYIFFYDFIFLYCWIIPQTIEREMRLLFIINNSLDGHLGWFHFSAIVYGEEMDIGVYNFYNKI